MSERSYGSQGSFRRNENNPFYDESIERDEEASLLVPTVPKRPQVVNRLIRDRRFAIFKRCLAQITWPRLKVLVVLMILVYTILLFSTEQEDGEKLHLGAAVRGKPMVY
jgi:hypothetical protein